MKRIIRSIFINTVLNISACAYATLNCLGEGKDFPWTAQTFGIHIQSCRKYLNIYLLGGFELLYQSSLRSQPSALNAEQQAASKKILTCDRSILISVPIIYCNPMKLLPFIFQDTFTVPKIRKS